MSWAIDFDSQYVRSLPVYLGIVGITWVAGWGTWAIKRVRTILAEIRPAFLVSDSDYGAFADRWIRLLCNRTCHFMGAGVLTVASWLYLSLASRLGNIPGFSESWSEGPHLWVKNLILGLYAVPIMLLIATMLIGAVAYAFFSWSIRGLRLVPLLDVAREQLRPITDFGLATGFAWSLGVSLVVLLFRLSFDPLTVGGILFLTGVGLLLFLWPQYAVHRALYRARQGVMSLAFANLKRELRGPSLYDMNAYIRHLLGPRGQGVAGFIRVAAQSNTWIANPADLLPYVGPLLLPVIALAISEVA